ncbi:hypothetical protein [Hymenobacter crusticola]|nr:hypothetical protein [Hymenobacter crusticola]
MVHSFLFAPFSDPARQEQLAAVENAFRAEAATPTTLLLGNLGAIGAPPVDAVILQPGRIALLVLVPQSGHLRVPALAYGAWRLNDQPIPSFGEADNPFAFYQHHKDSLLAWLSAQLNLAPTALPPLAGLVVLLAPVTYGSEVENQLSSQAAAHDFQLVNDLRQLPRRLRQLPPTSGAPTEAALEAWSTRLAAQQAMAEPEFYADDEEPSYGFWEQKARQLWQWLGAADVPADPPYGTAADPRQLEALRQELQRELQQQQQAAHAREATREQELVQLRQQLAQTPTYQQAAQQERAELEETLRVARAESAARNQELDARIQQLGQLIEQLRTQAAAPVVALPPSLAVSPAIPAQPKPIRKAVSTASPRPAHVHLRLTRVAFVVGVLLCLGLGGWAVVRLSKHYLATRKPKREQITRVARPAQNDPMQGYSDAATLTSQALDSTMEQDERQDEPLVVPDQDEPVVVHDSELIMQVTSDSAAKASEREEEAPAPDSIPQ